VLCRDWHFWSVGLYVEAEVVPTLTNLDLQDIQEARQRVCRTFPGTAFSSQAEGQYGVSDTVTIDLDVRKDGRKFRLVGAFEAQLELGCCRCLEAFSWPVSVDVDLLYLPASDGMGERDVQIEESDLSTAFYHDEQIDLVQLVDEQFQLTLPMKPLCRRDCRGLCAVCGGNRNATECKCVEIWEDPRLDVLRSLLKQ
jgi:uncharacterized protein|tara:strand:- start:693 stop:1283 length:591 start_codon:yes stop_codon:yes gene_type:complete